jgi:TonB-dependent receptor-like protein/carboxypeptidase family protein
MRSRRIDSNKQRTRVAKLTVGRPIPTTVAAAVAAILAAPTVVWGQSAEATLRGHASPNATITAQEIATGAVRHTTAAADGTYVLAGMPPGTYRVDAGPGTEQQITLSVSSTSSFDFVDSAARKAELAEVVVSGSRIVEVKTSEVGQIVDLHQIEVTPQITRNFLEFADTVPGMNFSVDAKGNTSLRGGAEVDQNVNVYIDGVGMKDYITNGGVSGQSGPSKAGDPGNPFPQLALDEYKVITSNYKAQFDQVASAAIIAQTKSGTNQFKGEAFGNFTNQNLRADTSAELTSTEVTNPKAQGESYEYGFAQGGPIIPNVAHFFVTYEHKDLSLPNSVFPNGQNGATLASLQPVLPANVFSQFGPTTNPFKEDLIFAKLDWEPSDRDRFELTDLTRVETSTNGASGQVATSAAYDFKNDNTRVMLLWQHAADRWTNETRVTYENTLDAPEQSSGAPAFTYDWFNPPGPSQQVLQINGQDPRSYFRYQQNGVGVQEDFTLNNLSWAGNHTIQFGAKFKGVDLKARDASEGANYYFAVDPTGTYPNPFQAVFTVNNPSQNISASSNDRQFGVYFQDTWQPISRLILDLGIRWDYETVPSWENYSLPQSIVNALLGPFPKTAPNLPQPSAGETYAQALALGGYNINDYIGNGSNRHAPTDEYQPRLGFSYDFQDDQRHVLFGGIGRSYDRNVFDTMSLERTKLALSEPTIGFYGTPYTLNGCTTAANASPTCVAWNNSYYTLSNLQGLANGSFGEIDLTNNHLKNPYSDQFSLGIRNRVGDWNTSVAIAQINSYNQILGHLGNRYANGAYYFNGAQWSAQGVPGLGSLILWDNAGKDRDTEILVSVEKPYTRESGWGAGFAYTYSRALQNNPYSYQSENAYEFDLPWPSDYPMLPSSAIPRHRLVITYSVDGPWGLLFGAKMSLATPTPINAIEGCSPATAAAVCHGYNAYPVVGYVRDWLQERILDVQATKNFEMGHDLSAYLRLDVLNVFNTEFYDPGAAIFSPSSTGAYGPPHYNPAADTLGVPLEVKLTAGFKW